MDSLPAVFSIFLSYLPFYFLSNRIFEKYKFCLSFGLFYISIVFIGFILQFFKLMHTFPIVLVILYIITLRYGKYEKIDKEMILTFILIFVLTSLPLFFVNTLPIEGHDVAAHAYLTKLITTQNSIYITWGLMFEGPVNYAPGFHLFTSILYFLGLSEMTGLIFTVPVFIFSIFAISIYPIAREFGLDRTKGLFAVFVAAYASLYALFPVVWGGFAQLAGTPMINYTFFFLFRYIKDKSNRNLLFFSSSFAVLFLSHYWTSVLFFLGLFCFWIVERNKRFVFSSLHGIILGSVFILPWIYRVITNTLKYNLGTEVLALVLLNPEVIFYKILLVLGPITLFFVIYSWNKKYVPLYLWLLLSLLLTQSQFLGIHIFNPARWIYGLAIPISILTVVGYSRFWERYFKNRIDFKTFIIIFIVMNVIVTESYFCYSSLIKHPPVPESDYETFLYIKELPGDTLIHTVGMSGTWIPFIADKMITTPVISSTDRNVTFLERRREFDELYESKKWDELERRGVEYVFISENMGMPPLDCEVVYKRLFKCGGDRY